MFEDLSDADLLSRCRAGSQAAWSTLVRRFQRLVYTVPRRAGLSEAAADDVFQLTFSRLFDHLGRIDDGSRVRSWLVTTAKRATLDALAAQHRAAALMEPASGPDQSPTIEEVADLRPLPEQALAEIQELDQVRRAVDRLEPRLRQFVELLFLQDEPLSYSEIARRLGLPEGSIGPMRARCLEKLRTFLDP
jgi:RNA polymerase sigma factor (sigma-70 family)